MTEDTLKIKIDELELQLESKDKEIIGYLKKIENLEDTIIRLEALIPDEIRKDSKKKGKIVGDSKLAIEMSDLEKQVRDLKDKMGFLRKEKIQLQRELEKYTKEKGKSTVIRIEEKKEPLETLVEELTLKINKQQQLIRKLKADDTKEEIDELKKKIAKLNEELEQAKASTKIKTEGKNKLDKEDSTPGDLQKKIEDFSVELNKKNLKIKDLEKTISTLKAAQKGGASNLEVESSEKTLKALSEELQRKLNTSKTQIKKLQEQLKEYKTMKAPVEKDSQQEIIDELRNKIKELTSKKQVERKIESPSDQAIIQDDPNLALRVRELKNFVEDLQKQNDQQRIEINSLRKKTTP
ncbi:MAG: hypothetical protein EU540_03155 [Promethearchaeota archaeon]|nr:MAG: hypothetical protein EU540_03155 [Candidatus Lokiarchaeota archaeon]